MKHKFIVIIIFLIFLFNIALYLLNNETINNNNTAIELANTITPTVLHGNTTISNIRKIIQIDEAIYSCSLNTNNIDIRELYDTVNSTIWLYSHEMSDAWLSENYSKYVALLAVHKEYLGMWSFIDNPTENYDIILNVSRYTCIVNYVVENLDTLTKRIEREYHLELPNNYTFAKIEEVLFNKWRTNPRAYAKLYDYKQTYLATPQITLDWALYGAWLELFNCSYLASFNITAEEARNGLDQLLSELNKPNNTLLLLMLYYYLDQDLNDIKWQTTERGSMGSIWKTCTNTTIQYRNTEFSDFSFIMYYAWFKNTYIYNMLLENASKQFDKAG